MPATLYRDAALADARGPQLRLGVSILVRDGRIAWIRPSDGEEDPGQDTEVVDASGATAVPGMVDAHSHVTMPGGAHWIQRGLDPPEVLLRNAEENGRLLTRAGVRWARDVGSPLGTDPVDGRHRALCLGVRDRWRGRTDRPYVRAAGTWVTRAGTLSPGLAAEAEDAAQLLAHALQQVDDGADLVKLYLDGPDPETPPWSAAEVRQVVEACHRRGVRVTAHATRHDGTRVCAEAGVDAIEHGFEIDGGTAALMRERGVVLVSTLTVMRSWRSFATTTRLERFTSDDGRERIRRREEAALEAVRECHRAGVAIAAGTDFGGGSPRANAIAWEVEALVEAGLQPWEALAAATWRGGELLGEPEAGVVREGGPADFLLVHGDPLSDPSALWRVWGVAWAG
jgi:imidazolonepropionase-like amidohydrolase